MLRSARTAGIIPPLFPMCSGQGCNSRRLTKACRILTGIWIPSAGAGFQEAGPALPRLTAKVLKSFESSVPGRRSRDAFSSYLVRTAARHQTRSRGRDAIASLQTARTRHQIICGNAAMKSFPPKMRTTAKILYNICRRANSEPFYQRVGSPFWRTTWPPDGTSNTIPSMSFMRLIADRPQPWELSV